MTAHDLTGRRFGRLTAERPVASRNGVVWQLRCDCGNVVQRKTSHLNYSPKAGTGEYLSCGCAHNFRTHDLSKSRLYKILAGMRKRCYSATCITYADYGARGIRICPEWLADPRSFADWALANGYAPGLTIERNDNDGDYEPSNCRWATKAEQNRNTRASHKIAFAGQIKTLAEWSRERGIGHATIIRRLRLGWPVDQALTIPPVVGRNCRSAA